MADFQGDLIGFEKDVDIYASDLTQTILKAAEDARSEPDFRQRIRGSIETVLQEVGLGFDYVDERIGTMQSGEVEAALAEQGLSISDVPFDTDDIHEGGIHPDAVISACVVDYKSPGILSTQSNREAALRSTRELYDRRRRQTAPRSR